MVNKITMDKNFESRNRMLDLQESILRTRLNLIDSVKKDHGPMSVFTGIADFFKKLFHKCDFKTIEVPASNEKGEIWIQECQCGQKQKVLFDGKGNCRSIIKL